MRSEQRDSYENQEAPYACYYGTGAPRRRRGGGGGWVVFFVVLLILTTAAALFAKRYDVTVTNDGGRVSISVLRKAPETREALPDTAPQEADMAEETADAEEQPPPQLTAALGTGATLTISDRKPDEAPEETEAGALTLQEIYKKMIPSTVSILTQAAQ